MTEKNKVLILVAVVLLSLYASSKNKEKRVFFEAPIVFDLDGAGIRFIPLKNSKILFDLDGDKNKEAVSWIDSGEGFLVLDLNKNDKIDDASEFFGKKSKAQNDAQELANFDKNNDGKIDQFDAIFSELKIWQDSNSNGLTDKGELTTLAENKVTSIDFCRSFLINKEVADVLIKREGFFTKNLKEKGLASVEFKAGR